MLDNRILSAPALNFPALQIGSVAFLMLYNFIVRIGFKKTHGDPLQKYGLYQSHTWGF